MSTQQTSWWFPWMMIMLALAIIFSSYYFGGSTLGLATTIGTVVGGAVAWSRRARA